MASGCEAGAAPSIWNANESAAGVTDSVGGGAVTANVIVTVLGLPVEPAAVTVTAPL